MPRRATRFSLAFCICLASVLRPNGPGKLSPGFTLGNAVLSRRALTRRYTVAPSMKNTRSSGLEMLKGHPLKRHPGTKCRSEFFVTGKRIVHPTTAGMASIPPTNRSTPQLDITPRDSGAPSAPPTRRTGCFSSRAQRCSAL